MDKKIKEIRSECGLKSDFESLSVDKSPRHLSSGGQIIYPFPSCPRTYLDWYAVGHGSSCSFACPPVHVCFKCLTLMAILLSTVFGTCETMLPIRGDSFWQSNRRTWKPSNVGFRKKAVTCEPWRISVAAAWHIWPEILVVPTYAQWPPRRHPVKGQRLTATNGPWFLHSQVEAWKGGRSQPSYTRGRRFSWRGYSEMGTRDWDRYREWYNQ